MNSRIAPLALILVASSCTPDYSTSKLVGNWNCAVRLPDGHEQMLIAKGVDPKAELETVHAQLREQGHDGSAQFEADGTVLLHGLLPEPGKDQSLRWRLTSESADRVTITMPNPHADGKRWDRTFVFVTPDIMREEGGLFDGLRFTRTPSAK